ncbi:redox-sensitive transcriptional activator SoxR [Undibacterium jejuense]|uniref:Redox-sensitive transcriptional activator SoxR n=1 Tax=Undibacterium jejuense TaxID=1344949 RepID=A0A923HJC6_9BURK|nr:redox-sensitive transcriptional activator SoxR [Undibacterium jejuense]MBC3863493.1 redox-sensitive transcriptional activator SoxR [Undibacterium jejuense]
MSTLKANDKGRLLSVGELASRSGVAISTIHFYEAKGLIQSTRNAGNQRRYTRDTLRRVAVIKVAQRIGISLASIKENLTDLPQARTPNANDWKRLSARWQVELDEKIAGLLELRGQLSNCIGCGCLSLQACALRNPEDELSVQGSGPRLLGSDKKKPGVKSKAI